MNAVVLAGGLGTRLRPVLGDRPKVLADVNGRPFVVHVLEQIASAGIRDVVVCTGFGADLVQRALGDSHGPLRIRYSRESEPLGTGGALALALPIIGADPALVLNGDSICRTDLREFFEWGIGRGDDASILLVRVADAGRYGRVSLGDGGRVERFDEKSGAGPGLVNAGAYLLRRSVVEAIPAGRAVSLEREVFPALAGRGLSGFPVDAPFLDIGTPGSLAEAPKFFAP